MLFKDIIGQQHIKNQLISSVTRGRIPHAQLFVGPEGSGSLALALAYAQFVNCSERREDDSCGLCPSCIKYEKLIHPDLHFTYPTISGMPLSTEAIVEWRQAIADNPYMNVFDWLQILEAGNKQGNITSEECRDIIKRLSMKSFESEYKVLIMWMPEYLRETGNTLLKIIEEPPYKTLFLLVANNSDNILPTIASRTQMVKIPRLASEEIADAMQRKHEVEPVQAASVAFLSEGDYNKALQIISQHDQQFFESFREWMLCCYSSKMLEVLRFVEKMSAEGREILKLFLQYGIQIFQQCLHIKHLPAEKIRLQQAEKEFAFKFAAFLNNSNINPLYEEFNRSIYHIERNANAKIVLFNLSLQIRRLLATK